MRDVVVEVLEPGQAEDQRCQEEAAVDVGPDQHQRRDRPQQARMGATLRDEEEQHGEERHPERLRPKPERDRRDGEGDEREQRGRPHRQAASPADRVDAAEDDPDEDGPQQHEARPAAEAVDGREDDLGAPLLVDPRQTRRRERPRVDVRDDAGVQDPVAGADEIGQVDGGEAADQGGEDGQGHGQEQPQPREFHPRMLAGSGADAHRAIGTGRAASGRPALIRPPRPPRVAPPGRPRRRCSRRHRP